MNTALKNAWVAGTAALISAPIVWATCGGGGGGGSGGIGGSMGGGGTAQVYPVPWKNASVDQLPEKGGLGLYWFPATQDELGQSSLRFSRVLSTFAAQCVQLGVADGRSPLGQKLLAPGQPLPMAILTSDDGTVIARVLGSGGALAVGAVERMLTLETSQREDALKERIKAAKAAQKSGDKVGAIAAYQAVMDQKCLFPKLAKDAAKGLKALGVEVSASIADAPNRDTRVAAAVEQALLKGLIAEERLNLAEAQRHYERARALDPADPAPLRYLAEFHRHHSGDWALSHQLFNELLAMPNDALSRAVALHGIGKMTIHDGKFQRGRELMEQSVEVFPLAIAYRNLAVYWNSEGELGKGSEYTRLAMALDPNDEYNKIFAAVFTAASGQIEAALAIARANESHLPASYNLAAIYAQAGDADSAIRLLTRHFFEYERTDAVRAKEMMEARVDAVFKSIYADQRFVHLTRGADGKMHSMVKDN